MNGMKTARRSVSTAVPRRVSGPVISRIIYGMSAMGSRKRKNTSKMFRQREVNYPMRLHEEVETQPERIGYVVVEAHYANSGLEASHLDQVTKDSDVVHRVRSSMTFDLDDGDIDEFDTEGLVRKTLRAEGYDPDRVIDVEHVEVQERRVYVGEGDEDRLQVTRKTLSKLLANAYLLMNETQISRDDIVVDEPVTEAELVLDGEVKTA